MVSYITVLIVKSIALKLFDFLSEIDDSKVEELKSIVFDGK